VKGIFKIKNKKVVLLRVVLFALFLFIVAPSTLAAQIWTVTGTQTVTQTFSTNTACTNFLSSANGYTTKGCSSIGGVWTFTGQKTVTQTGFTSQSACDAYAKQNKLSNTTYSATGTAPSCVGNTTKLTGNCESPCDPMGTGELKVDTSSQCAAGLNCCVSATATAPVTTTPVSTSTPMDNMVPGTTAAGGIVSCGRGGQPMCTLCDLIRGLNIIIQYLLRIAIGLALTIFMVAGVIYIVSIGNSGTIEQAKNAMKDALIGLIIILAAWLMINTALRVIGANDNLGITGVTAWGTFECTGTH